MCNICVFAGTTEGRELAEFLAGQPVQATVCVATEYGETLLPEAKNVTVLAGRIPVEDIIRMLQETRFDLVIDATHPYAASITESISTACRETETEYLRLLRQSSQQTEDVVCVENAAAAAAFLARTQGHILLTTGSKELAAYSAIPDFAQRVYARVLPMDASLAACREVGLKAAHIIAMQGPFSEEMDLATLRCADAAWMVTKDGGEAGGFPAKVSAARKAGAGLVVIGRPPQRGGIPFAAVLDVLCKRFGCTVRRRCYENVSRRNLGELCPEHRCTAPGAAEGYRFSKAMRNPGFIGVEDIRSTYLPMGFSQFKIEGRGLGSALVLEFLLYYLTKPEHQLQVREEIYLDNMLDLF